MYRSPDPPKKTASLPIQTPQLRASIYGEALREFIEAREFDHYLKWIKHWPSDIFEIKQQVYLIRQEMEKLTIRNQESIELTISLRILLEADHRYEEAFEIFIRLNDSDQGCTKNAFWYFLRFFEAFFPQFLKWKLHDVREQGDLLFDKNSIFFGKILVKNEPIPEHVVEISTKNFVF